MDQNLLKAFATLASFVGILFVIYIILKKNTAKKKNGGVIGNDSITILSKTTLLPKGFLYVVAIGQRKMLIGSTEHSISLITDLSNSVEKKAEIQAEFDMPQPSTLTSSVPINSDNESLSFSTFLKTILSRESTS